MAAPKLTVTQTKILNVLEDGLPHPLSDLLLCLNDSEMGSVETVQTHLSYLRNILRPKGEDVLCEIIHGCTHYRQVRLLGSAYTGYR